MNRCGDDEIGNFIKSHSVDNGGNRCRINGNGNEWRESWKWVMRNGCGDSVLGERKLLAIDRGESCA